MTKVIELVGSIIYKINGNSVKHKVIDYDVRDDTYTIEAGNTIYYIKSLDLLEILIKQGSIKFK